MSILKISCPLKNLYKPTYIIKRRNNIALRLLKVEDRKLFLEQKNHLKTLNFKKLTEKNKIDIVRLMEKKEEIFNRSILTWEKFYDELFEFPVHQYRKQRIFFECGKHFKVRDFSLFFINKEN